MANDAGPEAKQWALAATAILTTTTRRTPRYDRLGGADKTPEPDATAKTILANSWSIDGREKLVTTLQWLGSGGNTADYAKAAAAYAQAPPQQRQQDPSLAFVNQFGQDIGNRGLLAWDLGRLLGVAGWGYLAGYCSEEEAWGAALSAGARLRATYTSWDEFGRHYRLGALFWDASAVGSLDAVLGQLASAPDSPWRLVGWSLDAKPTPAPAYGATPAPAYGASPGGQGYGAPQAYGGVPVINPPPPGASGAAQSYDGVPVIAPVPGAPIPYGASGATGSTKRIFFILAAVVAVFFLGIVGWLAVHFLHRDSEPAHEREPAHEHEREHGHKKGGH